MMLVGGIALARLAFPRPVATFAANEVAPAVQVVAQTAAAAVGNAHAQAGRACLSCGVLNDRDAKFCDACGSSMPP